MTTAAVITVTNGKRFKELAQCIESVQNQTYFCTHYVLCDYNFETFMEIKRIFPNVKVCYWDNKIGGNGWSGQKWLAAAPHLISEDVTFVCNDDDWYEPNHVQSIIEKIQEGADWAYSFRNIYDQAGNFICQDNCEALGEESPVWIDDNHHFVDWCMWGMKTRLLQQICHVLNNVSPAADRMFYATAKKYFPNFIGTKLHTFNFRLGGHCGVQREFFEFGNGEMLKRFDGKLPWILT